MTRAKDVSTPVAPPVHPPDPATLTFIFSLLTAGAIVAFWALDTAQTLSGLIVKHTGLARTHGLTEEAWIATLSACAADRKCGPWLSTQFRTGMGGIYWSFLLPFITTPIVVKYAPKKKIVAAKDPGLATWEKKEKMTKFLQGSEDLEDPFMAFMGYLKSGTVGGEFDAKDLPPMFIPREDWCQNTLVWGGIRSGKTTSFFQPNIFLAAHLGMSCVVFDVKWPQKDSGFFETIGYWHARGRRVVLLAPFENYGTRVNLLAGVNSFSDALEVADAVFPPPEFQEERGKHYNDKKRFFIASMVWLLRTEKGDSATFRDVLDYALLPDDRLMEWLETIRNTEAKSIIMSYREAGEQKFAEDKNGIISALKVFFNESVVYNTSGGEDAINLEECVEKPTLTVVGINMKNMMDGSGEVLFRLYKRMIDKAAMNVAERQGGKLRNHLAIFLDEFPSIGRLNYMMRAMGALRSFNISHHLGIQNDAQSQLVYGELYWKAISTNVVARVIMFPRGINGDDAHKVSQTIGRTTASEIGYSGSHHINPLSMDGSTGASSRLVERDLLAFEEFSSFTLGEAVIRMNGQQPIRAQLCPMGMKTVEGSGIKPGSRPNVLYPLFADTVRRCPGGLIAYTNRIIQSGELRGKRASLENSPQAPAPESQITAQTEEARAGASSPLPGDAEVFEMFKMVDTATGEGLHPGQEQSEKPEEAKEPEHEQAAQPASPGKAPRAHLPKPEQSPPPQPEAVRAQAPAQLPAKPTRGVNLDPQQAWTWVRACMEKYIEVLVLDEGETINVRIDKEHPERLNGEETIQPMIVGGLLERNKTGLEVRLSKDVMREMPEDLRQELIDFPEARGVYLWLERNPHMIDGTPEREAYVAKCQATKAEVHGPEVYRREDDMLACSRTAIREMLRNTGNLRFPTKRLSSRDFDLIPVGSLRATAEAIRLARAEGEKTPPRKLSRRERQRNLMSGIRVESVTPSEGNMET